jgi:outer membrane biosynthesis protein TonB
LILSVATRPIIFVLALAFPGMATPTGAFASDLWDERPLRIIQTVAANFPAAVAAEGIVDGEVRAVLQVDAAGKFLDCLVTAYTRREFADELMAAVRDWSFQPAHVRGEPVGSRAEVAFAFHARGMVLSLTPQETFTVNANRLSPPGLTSLRCRLSDLDAPVRTLHVVEPRHPGRSVKPAASPPTVVIDFYIDTEGRPRMPVVQRATHDVYAIAAIDALAQWRFVPPTRLGRPAIVRATQQFTFSEDGSR